MALVLIALDHFSGQRNIGPTPDDTERDLARLVREMQTEINNIEAGIVGPDDASRGHMQATAATATDVFMIAPAAGQITIAQAAAETGAAAGEDMQIDVLINGVSALSAPIPLDNAAGTAVQTSALGAAVTFAQGDKISVERTYTAGGGPAPMLNTLVDIGYRLD
jgi:hypothetical protein